MFWLFWILEYSLNLPSSHYFTFQNFCFLIWKTCLPLPRNSIKIKQDNRKASWKKKTQIAIWAQFLVLVLLWKEMVFCFVLWIKALGNRSCRWRRNRGQALMPLQNLDSYWRNLISFLSGPSNSWLSIQKKTGFLHYLPVRNCLYSNLRFKKLRS